MGTTSAADDVISNTLVGNIGNVSITFIATTTISYINFLINTATTDFIIVDNISVTPVEYDTSILTELSNPISFIDDKPYQVASGTPMDRLVDYPSIPKNIMESTYVDGDLEVGGNLSGMSGFDLGQSWVDVTSERALDVTYTNDTGKPIMVLVSFVATTSVAISPYVTVDSITHAIWAGADATSRRCAVSFIIPSGSTYIVPIQTNVEISNWSELR